MDQVQRGLYEKGPRANIQFEQATVALHTAAEPAVRSAVKILVSQPNDTIKAFFFAANKNKNSAQVPLASTSTCSLLEYSGFNLTRNSIFCSK